MYPIEFNDQQCASLLCVLTSTWNRTASSDQDRSVLEYADKRWNLKVHAKTVVLRPTETSVFASADWGCCCMVHVPPLT